MPIVTPARWRPSVPSLALIAASLIVAGGLIAANPSASSASGSTASRPDPRGGFAGSSGDANRGEGTAALSGVGPTIPGLDVSHWQNTIDWTKVAAADMRFAFVKATDGDDTVDPTFITNRDGAEAHGLRVGAYHFARPDASPGDAQREARFFVNEVQPAAGDLLPVLDIEVNNGLDQTEMTRWAQRWVAQVRTLTGITPLVYTSPYGWLQRFGDTTALAAGGSPLWVAHWGVPSPTVPAQDWNGRGWVVWQHTSSGHLPGIGTNVDLDRLAGTRLRPLMIRSLSIAVDGGAGTVSSSPATLDCRTNCQRNVDPDTTITLSATPDDHAYFTGWGGNCGGTGPTCILTMHGDRNVTARFVTDITPPTPTLTAPTGFTGPASVRFDEPTRGITAANVVLREPSGSADIPVTRVCRSLHGIVPCSNVNVRTVTLSPAHPWIPGRDYAVVIDPAGVRTRVRDRIGNATPTTLLGFAAPTGMQERSEPLTYTWGTMQSPAAYGGSFALDRQPGASFRFAFRGTRVTWYTVMGPSFGKAEVLIDGRGHGVFDLWARHRITKVPRTFSGLRGGSHVITIRALGTRRPAATDRVIAVDAFRAGGAIVATPHGTPSWRAGTAAGASAGGFRLDDIAGAALTLRFDGTGLDWTTITGPAGGRAGVYLDGMLVRTVDLYSATQTFGVVESFAGLADGRHVLRIVASGRGQPASAGTLVSIDRIDVV